LCVIIYLEIIEGLTFGETPMVCGGNYQWGTTYHQCWKYINGAWRQQDSYNMPWPNKFFALSLPPFKNSSHSLFMAGGFDGTRDINKVAVS